MCRQPWQLRAPETCVRVLPRGTQLLQAPHAEASPLRWECRSGHNLDSTSPPWPSAASMAIDLHTTSRHFVRDQTPANAERSTLRGGPISGTLNKPESSTHTPTCAGANSSLSARSTNAHQRQQQPCGPQHQPTHQPTSGPPAPTAAIGPQHRRTAPPAFQPAAPPRTHTPVRQGPQAPTAAIKARSTHEQHPQPFGPQHQRTAPPAFQPAAPTQPTHGPQHQAHTPRTR